MPKIDNYLSRSTPDDENIFEVIHKRHAAVTAPAAIVRFARENSVISR